MPLCEERCHKVFCKYDKQMQSMYTQTNSTPRQNHPTIPAHISPLLGAGLFHKIRHKLKVFGPRLPDKLVQRFISNYPFF